MDKSVDDKSKVIASAWQRYEELVSKIAPVTRIICDTPKMAAEHGVTLGTTVLQRNAPTCLTSIDEQLEYASLQSWFHYAPHLMLGT